MVVILEAISGPITGRRLEVRGGSIVRVGRTGKSDYAIAEDSYLSGMHFSVECDGTQCRIRDLGSSNGTFVNGSRITDQVVREGDSVVAGGSTFRIYLDLLPEITGVGLPRVKTAATPISVATQVTGDFGIAAGRQPVYSPAETALLKALYAPGEQVFAVVDASRDSRIPAFLDAAGETIRLWARPRFWSRCRRRPAGCTC
jgi:pSer/pThr/pTyr-binding forkhead associated (FHA) protein